MKYSDQNIQDFLDNNLTPDNYRQFKEQLNSDSTLKNRVQAFNKIYIILNDKKGFELDPRFTSQVMKKAEIEELGSLHFKLWHLFIAMFVIIACINVSLYYVDMKSLVEDLKFSTQVNTDSVPAIINDLNSLPGNQNFDITFPIVAILILVLLGLIDRFVFSPRHKTVSSYR